MTTLLKSPVLDLAPDSVHCPRTPRTSPRPHMSCLSGKRKKKRLYQPKPAQKSPQICGARDKSVSCGRHPIKISLSSRKKRKKNTRRGQAKGGGPHHYQWSITGRYLLHENENTFLIGSFLFSLSWGLCLASRCSKSFTPRQIFESLLLALLEEKRITLESRRWSPLINTDRFSVEINYDNKQAFGSAVNKHERDWVVLRWACTAFVRG